MGNTGTTIALLTVLLNVVTASAQECVESRPSDANPIAPQKQIFADSQMAAQGAYFHQISLDMFDQGFQCCANPVPDPSIPNRVCRGLVNKTSGMTCVGSLPGYPEPVALIIPPNYTRQSKANFSLFLHGNNAGNNGPAFLLESMGLPEIFSKSGRNTIFVVPVSRGTADAPTRDFDAYFAKKDAFKRFVGSLGELIKGTDLSEGNQTSSISLQAHSGGGRTMYSILKGDIEGKSPLVDEVYCYDCLYHDREKKLLVTYAQKPGRRLWSVVTGQGGTAELVGQFQEALATHDIKSYGRDIHDAHYEQLQKAKADSAYAKPLLKQDDLANYQIGLLYDGSGFHNKVVQYAAKLLALPARTKSKSKVSDLLPSPNDNLLLQKATNKEPKTAALARGEEI